MVDSEETCIVVMVYNMANSWGVLIGDTVVIPEPLIKRNVITHKNEVGFRFVTKRWSFILFLLMLIFLLWQSFDFRSIRADSPLLLIVNGKKQNVQSQIATSISCKPHREWPEEDARSFCSRVWKHKDGYITTPSYATKVLVHLIVHWWHHKDSEAEEHYQLSIIRLHFPPV